MGLRLPSSALLTCTRPPNDGHAGCCSLAFWHKNTGSAHALRSRPGARQDVARAREVASGRLNMGIMHRPNAAPQNNRIPLHLPKCEHWWCALLGVRDPEHISLQPLPMSCC